MRAIDQVVRDQVAEEQVEATLAAPAASIAAALVQICRDSFGGGLRAVVLTGSLARNEATLIRKGEQTILLSDAEAIVVLHDGTPLPSRQVTQTLCSVVERRLTALGISVHISISMVHAEYLRRLPAHIFSYELRECGRVLFGDAAMLEQIPSYTAAELSPEDAWRILGNRLIEQMAEPAESSAETNLESSRYRSIKLCLDLAGSMLAFSGRFQAGYRNRLACIEQLALTAEGSQLPIPMSEFLPLLRLCTAAKLHPEADGFADDLADGAAENVTNWAWQTWLWELQQLSGSSCENTTYPADPDAAQEMICCFGRHQGPAKLVRGWLYAARRTGWLRSVRYWPRWFPLLAMGFTPRHAVYLAACAWQQTRFAPVDVSPCTASPSLASPSTVSPNTGGNFLPVLHGPITTAAEVARELVWNYREFVMETRA
jgi:hypothetical protein